MSVLAPVPAFSFRAFHAATSTLTAPERLTVFFSLPPAMQQGAWRQLRYEIERERESERAA